MRVTATRNSRRKNVALIEALAAIALIAVGLAALVEGIDSCSLVSLKAGDLETVRILSEQVLAERLQKPGEDDDGSFASPFEDYSWKIIWKQMEDYEFWKMAVTISRKQGSKVRSTSITRTIAQ